MKGRMWHIRGISGEGLWLPGFSEGASPSSAPFSDLRWNSARGKTKLSSRHSEGSCQTHTTWWNVCVDRGQLSYVQENYTMKCKNAESFVWGLAGSVSDVQSVPDRLMHISYKTRKQNSLTSKNQSDWLVLHRSTHVFLVSRSGSKGCVPFDRKCPV